jgi:hypothetical protein
MRAMRSHLTPEFMATMSGLVHAMRTDSGLADRLRSESIPLPDETGTNVLRRRDTQPFSDWPVRLEP